MSQEQEYIQIRGAKQHNLADIDVDLPINKFIVITGLSGSGKSTLAFDTIYAEGQRRYVESLSSYARQFLGLMNKPEVESIKGLSPAISIEQKSISHNPRSTVGTITEIYDYFRLLFARIGEPHCPLCGKKIFPQDAQSITKNLISENEGQDIQVLAPVVRGKKGRYDELFKDLFKQGYARVRVDGKVGELTDYIGEGKKTLDRYKQHNIEIVVDRLKVSSKEKSRLQSSIETALKLAGGLVLISSEKKLSNYNVGKSRTTEKMYSQHLACTDCGLSFDELQPRMFSFNTPFGACPICDGLGSTQNFDPDLIMPDKDLSIYEGAIDPWKTQIWGWRGQMLEALAKHFGFDLDTPVKKLPKKVVDVILNGTDEKIKYQYEATTTDSYWEHSGGFEGVIPHLERLYKQTQSEAQREKIEKYMLNKPCTACKGARLKEESLAVTINDKNIWQVTTLSVKRCKEFFESLKLTVAEQKIAKQILKEIKSRLQFLINVGLDYLTLERSGGTLAGGEAQRIRLATQIGSELRGVLYILDEPSIGLHQRDNKRLIDTLKQMRDLGNTVIVVEHDEDTMREADFLLDLGPGAGIHGGKVVAQGTAKDLMKNPKSLTGRYLKGVKNISVPKKRRRPEGFIRLRGASHNNLKKIDVDFPTGVFGCVTGVSGSGKSTLVNDTLHKILAKKFHGAKEKPGEYKSIDNTGYLDKVIIIDQKPIGRTPRSNPATYTKVFTDIRDLFAQTKEAKIRGYKPGRFSFNVADGRCGNCEGDGVIKIEMNFLPDVYITCEQCKGKRYDDETLQVTFKEKNIADVLEMTVEEALEFFKNIPKIKNKLQTLYDVGLGYIELGQSATTLSGGEAQRIKLATELSKRDTGRTLYILDEPTTGLHFADIEKLLSVLNRLVDKGNSVLVIEHNLDVIKTADYIIDLGPEGGEGGGEVIAKGTPEEIIKVPQSHTGKFLKKVLK